VTCQSADAPASERMAAAAARRRTFAADACLKCAAVYRVGVERACVFECCAKHVVHRVQHQQILNTSGGKPCRVSRLVTSGLVR